MRIIWGSVAAIIIAFIAWQTYSNFSTVHQQTIGVTQLVNLLRDTLSEVKQMTSTDANFPEFKFADLSLMTRQDQSVDTNASVVIVSGETSLDRNESTRTIIRVSPPGNTVSATANELALTIVESVRETVRATRPDLSFTSLSLEFKIGVKATATGKVELEASDIAIGSQIASHQSSESGMTLFFSGM